MVNASHWVGIDVGTTQVKAIVCSESGNVQGFASQGYPIESPQPGWAEQDPTAIFAAVIQATRNAIDQARVAPNSIAAVGFSTAMHSLITIDAQNQLLTSSLIWADNRSKTQADQLRQSAGLALYHRTGTPIHPMSPLSKLIWLREEASEIFQRAAKFISIKEYLLLQLFDRLVVDESIASATGLFNLQQHTWDTEALSWAGIRADQLSELVPTTQILRGMNPGYAAAMGLSPDTPVVVGASDGVLANLGVGAIASDQMVVTIGTSSAVRQVVTAPLTDPEGRLFCYAMTDQHWVVGGAANSGGMVLQWFGDRFATAEMQQARQAGIDPYNHLIQRASTVPAGAENLLFLPFLAGERAPYWNPEARGVFFGLSLQHEPAHLIRAVLEGIIFNTYAIATRLQHLTGPPRSILACGGFARSPFWRQLLSHVFGAEVLVPAVTEASALGAVFLSRLAIGQASDLAQVTAQVQIQAQHQPDPALSDQYHRLFAIYERVYQQSIAEFTALQHWNQAGP